MKDITNFCANHEIKPELSMVYVHKKDGNTYAVATDTFRLIEIKLDEFLNGNIEDGYYSKENWKKMCKAYNKKNQDLQKFSETMKANKAVYGEKDWKYPDYKNIIPAETVAFKPVKVNREYFIDFISMITDNFGNVDLDDIKMVSKNNMLYYVSEDIKLLLMPTD